jgi:hypothetical protein
MTTRPVPMQWNGEAMIPTRGFAALADKQFVIGEVYTLDNCDPTRSMVSHRHYFAAVYDAWLNLPEEQSQRFATADHLRKYALIKAGFHDERSIVCASRAEALRVAAFIQPMDEYALVVTSEAAVRVYTAKHQNMRAMGRKVFQESKDAVLGVLADMLGVPVADLNSREQQGAGGGRNLAGGARQ